MKIRSFVLLGIVAGVCLLLLTLQMRGRAAGTSDALAFFTTPVQTVLARVNRAAFGVWSTYVDWKNVRSENRRLRDEAQQLRVAALQVVETSEENRRLRRLLKLKESLPLATLSGEIIAREWGGWVRSLTVNRGRSDQVARMTAVIGPDGLIGRIVDVRPGSSVVQVLTDPASTVGAHVVRTRTPGMVEGEARGTIRFKYMARDGSGIQVGDVVVTSGTGGLFPRGLPVGRVRAIDDRGSALFHYAQISPAVDFARIDEVLLLTGDGARDVAGFFQEGAMTRTLLAVAVLGGGVVHAALGPVLRVVDVAPDIPLIVVVLLALRRGPEFGCAAGFVAGLLQDTATGGLIGVQALTKAVIGFAIGGAGGRLSVTQPLVQVPGLVLLTIAEGLARFALLQLFRFPAPFGELMTYVVLPQALYNGFLGAALVLALTWTQSIKKAA